MPTARNWAGDDLLNPAQRHQFGDCRPPCQLAGDATAELRPPHGLSVKRRHPMLRRPAHALPGLLGEPQLLSWVCELACRDGNGSGREGRDDNAQPSASKASLRAKLAPGTTPVPKAGAEARLPFGINSQPSGPLRRKRGIGGGYFAAATSDQE